MLYRSRMKCLYFMVNVCAVELIVKYITLLLNAIKFKLVLILSGLTWFFIFKFTVFRTTSKWRRKKKKTKKKTPKHSFPFDLIIAARWGLWAMSGWLYAFLNIVFVTDSSKIYVTYDETKIGWEHPFADSQMTIRQIYKKETHTFIVHHIFVVHSFNSMLELKIPAEKKHLKTSSCQILYLNCDDVESWDWGIERLSTGCLAYLSKF